MSAVDSYTRIPPDGVRRYTTRIRCIVHSHNTAYPLDLSDDVENCTVSKVLKGPGNAQVALVARVNYLNVIQPNDYINIYFDNGSGDGWVRTFFGYVDRVSESYQVQNEGGPTSRYVLSCTDFSKAFLRTQIYFNPYLANRRDFAGRFIGANNIGGLQLQMSGVAVSGSPPDIVQNLIFMLFGFGSQFIMPSSYANNARPQIERLRNERKNYIYNKLPASIRQRLQDEQSIDALFQQANTEAESAVQEDIRSGRLPDDLSAAQYQNAVSLRERNQLQQFLNNDFQLVSRVAQVRNSSNDNSFITLLDVVDPITFVEDRAMDGYTVEESIWQQQGPLMSILESVSNEPVNELFFDLRAVGSLDEQKLDESWWAREPDEIGGNVASLPNQQNGVKYVPALVMREYPFNTIENIDASNITVLGGSLGLIPFGAIFSNGANQPGRHTVIIPSINLEDRAANRAGVQGIRHLDVAVISEKEIMSSDFGRSDNDHFNLTEFISMSILGSDERFFMSDVIPISTPIHIARHGLRVRSLSTRFARFSMSAIAAEVGSREETVEEEQQAAEAASTTPTVLPEHPHEADIPSGTHWRGLVNLAQAYGVGLNVYILARTMFSEYGFNSVSDPIHPGVLVPAWAAVNIAKTGWRAGGRHRAFSTDAQGNRVYSTTNVALGILGSQGALGGIEAHTGEHSQRPQSTARFPGDIGGDEVRTQLLAARNAFRLSLTSTQQALVAKYFDVARKILRGDPDVADPAPVGGTTTFRHAPFPGHPGSSEIEERRAIGQEFYSVDPAPWTNIGTFGYAAVGIERNTNSEPVATPSEDTDALIQRAIQVSRNEQPDAGTDTQHTRAQLIRWAMLHDHWYQHNLEYLNGTVQMRGAPEIRVGYRLDIRERGLSFYVEGTSHQWTMGQAMTTQLQLTRGQPNDPYPIYVFPASELFDAPEHQRQIPSRLAQFFASPDLRSVQRALVIRGGAVDLRQSLPPSIDDENAIKHYEELILRANEGHVNTEEVLENQRRAAAVDEAFTDLDDALNNLERAGTESTSTVTGTDAQSGFDPNTILDLGEDT